MGHGVAHEVDAATLPCRTEDFGNGGLQPLAVRLIWRLISNCLAGAKCQYPVQRSRLVPQSLREQDVELVSFGEARSSGRPCPTRRSRQERSDVDFDLEIEGVVDERDLIADRVDHAPGDRL